MTNSSRSCIAEVAEVIQQDQALAIRVLRIANSSFFGRGKTVQTLADAARRIGMSGVRDAVVAILAIDRFSGTGVGGLNAQYFWEHSLASAVLAQLVGETIRSQTVGHLFLGGFLHDIGRFILGSKFPEQYKWVLTTAAEQNIDPITLEREVFGLTHADVTDDFLNRLGVHAVVRQAASHHSLGTESIKHAAGDSPCALMVALANRMAHALALGDSGSSMLSPVQDYITALGLNREAVSSIVQEAVQRTGQTRLFYASQSQEKFHDSLPSEISQTKQCSAQIVVLKGHSGVDPVELFFERLGLLNTRSPTLAVVSVATQIELTRPLSELKELESTVGVSLPLLVASPGASVGLTPSEAENRPWATTPMPGRYQFIIKAVADLAAAAKTGPHS